MPDKFGAETVNEITVRYRQDHPVAKLRFELTRFNSVLVSSTPFYLVKGLVPRGGLIIVWGPPKCGKSFWTFDVAMHIALGISYRGRRVQQGAVVYLALEGGYGFRARIEAFRRTHGDTNAPFFLESRRSREGPQSAYRRNPGADWN
jgi:AAA domain